MKIWPGEVKPPAADDTATNADNVEHLRNNLWDETELSCVWDGIRHHDRLRIYIPQRSFESKHFNYSVSSSIKTITR